MWGAGGSALGDRTGPHTPATQMAHALGRETRAAWRVLTPLHPPRQQASQAVAVLPTSHTQMGRPGSASAPDITSSETPSPIREYLFLQGPCTGLTTPAWPLPAHPGPG